MAGPCPDASGVTVVVDFQSLGRDTIVRCAPGSPSSGFDALTKAGITFSQVSSNPGFLCKIEGLPAPEGYARNCSVIPPTSAYWGYWVAPRGQAWCYSNVGASRVPVPGTVEGWSFSTGTAEGGTPPRTPTPPAVAGAPTSVSKATCPSPPTTTTTTGPASTTPPPPVTTAAPTRGTSATAPAAGDATSTSGAPVDGTTSSTNASNTTTASTSRGDEQAAGDLRISDDDGGGGSPVGVALGVGAVTLLGGAAAATARRRARAEL